ncbi:MAG: hypothetical protein CSB48_13225 [Proteobacteria bacterium]|nr:MAG: hypothetical protein CSB48_13225 [Pseudomonadota bacterium]
MDFEGLKSLGLTHFTHIEKYSLRSESDHDILKIYYDRGKGALFKKSEKFHFHRPTRIVKWDSASNNYSEVHEVSPLLTKVLSELDTITDAERYEQVLKEHILEDLRHLEKVFKSKIREIEDKIEQLQ